MSTDLLHQRLFKFVQSDSELSMLFDQCQGVVDFVDYVEGELEMFDSLVLAYKAGSGRWQKFTGQSRIGLHPCANLKAVERTERKVDEKLLVLCGWFSGDGDTQGCCAYCGIPLSIHEVTVDHVDPQARGGSQSLSNLVPACIDCNQEKGDQTVSEFLLAGGLTEVELREHMADWQLAFESRTLAGPVWQMRLSASQCDRLSTRSLFDSTCFVAAKSLHERAQT